MTDQPQFFCQFCPHTAHPGKKCDKCRCKNKARWWQKMLGGLGNAIGEAMDQR